MYLSENQRTLFLIFNTNKIYKLKNLFLGTLKQNKFYN